jgi:glycosyltransferase involved in cell wall biosynthesis
MTSASAVVTVHRQSRILVPTLRSIIAARDFARDSGHSVELVVVLDRADPSTTNIVYGFESLVDHISIVDFGDPGLARRHGVEKTSHDYIFFHDADDLYGTTWYTSFLTLVTNAQFDENTVYHGEVVVGFGLDKYFRRQLSSTEGDFDPMAMTAQWYFLTNLFAHRTMFDRFPIPSHDFKSGLGHDDWAWSCDTLAGGSPRIAVPNTVSFYREKEGGVGKIPGVIHPPSKLFDPEYVREDTRIRISKDQAARQYPFGSTLHARDLAREGHVPKWVYGEIRRQAVFEPLLTDLFDQQATPPAFRTHSRMPGMAIAYRLFCEWIDLRPKVLLSLPAAGIPMLDRFIEEIATAFMSASGNAFQLVIIIDKVESKAWADVLWVKYSALTVCCTELVTRYSIPLWLRGRFLMRFYLQFAGSIVLDCGADFFREIVSEFSKPIARHARLIGMLYPSTRNDILSPIRMNILQNITEWGRTYETPIALYSFSKAFAESVTPRLGSQISVLPESAAQAWEELGLRRFAENGDIRKSLRNQAGFRQVADFFLNFHSLSGDAAVEGDKVAQPYHVAAASMNTDAFAGRMAIESTQGAWWSNRVRDSAWRQFTATPAVSILVPQVKFFRDERGNDRFFWIDNVRCMDVLQSVFELNGQYHQDIPFFVVIRLTFGGSRLHSRLAFANQKGGLSEMLAEIVRLPDRTIVAPLPEIICAHAKSSISSSRAYVQGEPNG